MVKLQDLQRVNAVLDAQGFYIDGKFCPVELTVVGRYFFRHYPLRTNITSLSSEDRKSAEYATTHIHGLELDTFNDAEWNPEAPSLISCLQNFIGDQSLVFGVKNTHLAKILASHDLEFVDLEDKDEIRVPTLKELDMATQGLQWSCGGHAQPGLRCSVRKASLLWKWIQDRVATPPPNESSDSEDGCSNSDYLNCDSCGRNTFNRMR
jgi:hypothetical protein